MFESRARAELWRLLRRRGFQILIPLCFLEFIRIPSLRAAHCFKSPAHCLLPQLPWRGEYQSLHKLSYKVCSVCWLRCGGHRERFAPYKQPLTFARDCPYCGCADVASTVRERPDPHKILHAEEVSFWRVVRCYTEALPLTPSCHAVRVVVACLR